MVSTGAMDIAAHEAGHAISGLVPASKLVGKSPDMGEYELPTLEALALGS